VLRPGPITNPSNVPPVYVSGPGCPVWFESRTKTESGSLDGFSTSNRSEENGLKSLTGRLVVAKPVLSYPRHRVTRADFALAAARSQWLHTA
jgi:hypothetical protein